MAVTYDLMIDLETMGLPPDGALISIGAVFFDIPTQTVGPTFSRTIHLATSVRDGGKINAATVMWWLRQGDDARKSVAYGGADIHVVLKEFSEFIDGVCGKKTVRPWGNSASFDMGILGGAYQRSNLEVPWFWANERDFRTVQNLYSGAVKYDPSEKGDGAHDAAVDARFQVEHLFKIKRLNSLEHASTTPDSEGVT